jgi:hypothetical protein
MGQWHNKEHLHLTCVILHNLIIKGELTMYEDKSLSFGGALI